MAEEKKPEFYEFGYKKPGTPRVCIRNARVGHTPQGERYIIEHGINVDFHNGRARVPSDHPDIELILKKLRANLFVFEIGKPVKGPAPSTELIRGKSEVGGAPGFAPQTPPQMVSKSYSSKDILGE